MNKPNLWLPEPDPVVHQAIGKLAEEAAEVGKACARALIQGIDGVDPKTQQSNRDALLDEMCDMQALLCVVGLQVFGIPDTYEGHNCPDLQQRVAQKIAHKTEWLDMVRDHYAKGGA